jgi:uncharacterized RDD family membrane protein YckC
MPRLARRIAAALIDGTILLPPYLLMVLVAGESFAISALALVIVAYHATGDVFGGQTAGKWLVSLRVVRLDSGGGLDWWRAIAREAIFGVAVLGISLGREPGAGRAFFTVIDFIVFADLLSILIRSDRRALHDILVGSEVTDAAADALFSGGYARNAEGPP